MIVNADLRQVLQLERPLVCVDVETHDKCVPEKAYIVEIGLIVFYPDGREPKRWGSPIRLPNGVRISEDATSVHHITNDEINKTDEQGKFIYPLFSQIASNLVTGFTNVDFCGYNVNFDLRCISTEMRRARIEWSYKEAHILDPLAMWRKLQPRTLTDAVKKFAKREPTDAHRALADISDTVDACMGMLIDGEHEVVLPRTVKECHELCFDDGEKVEKIDEDGKFVWKDGKAVIYFGKHKGTHVEDPSLRQYLGWMLKGDFSPDTRRVVMEILSRNYPKKASVPDVGRTSNNEL